MHSMIATGNHGYLQIRCAEHHPQPAGHPKDAIARRAINYCKVTPFGVVMLRITGGLGASRPTVPFFNY